MDYYHCCQQYEDLFRMVDIIKMYYILFTTLYFYGTISLKLAQYKRRNKSTILIFLLNFKIFLKKNLKSFRS